VWYRSVTKSIGGRTKDETNRHAVGALGQVKILTGERVGERAAGRGAHGVEYLTQALYPARHNDISRMEDEARALRAAGVLGVPLSLSSAD
jgi:uncharacterized protein YbjQ (UPF0145 family)